MSKEREKYSVAWYGNRSLQRPPEPREPGRTLLGGKEIGDLILTQIYRVGDYGTSLVLHL